MALGILRGSRVYVTLDDSQLVFVHPSGSDPSFVRGTVTLYLPRRKAIQSVHVSIEESCNSYGGYGWAYEMKRTTTKELVLDVKATLEAGEHSFRFRCIIPPNTAVFQRCTYGRVVHWLKASVEYSSVVSLPTTSKLVAVSIIANPDGPGDPPSPLDSHVEHFTDLLGPIAVTFTSPHLTVSSLVNVQVTIMAPFVPITVLSILPFISQAYAISYDATSKVSRPLAERIPLPMIQSDTTSLVIARTNSSDSARSMDRERVDEVPLMDLRAQEEFVWKRLVRVPTDEIVRPSTLPATQTKIRVIHGLHSEVKFRIEGEETIRSVVVGTKAVISACCCVLEGLLLPSYSRDPPPPLGASRPPGTRCLCDTSLEEMIEREGMVSTRAEASNSPEQVERSAERDKKSPVGHQT